jgi:outer membrane protein OmpA-like peptidoglycan-associated protein
MKKITLLTTRPILLLFFLFFFLSSFAYAQPALTELETLLDTSAVTYAQAARFVLEAADKKITPNAEEAFNYAAQQGWLPKNAAPDSEARLDGISLLLMRSFDVKGGIMYSLTKNSRYACRELVYKNVIIGRNDPAMKVTGERLIFYVGRLLSDEEIMPEAFEPEIDSSEEEAVEIEQERSLAEEEAAARREELVAEISAMIIENEVADTTVEETNEGIKITLSNIQFAADSTALPDSEKIKLQEIAGILRNIPGIKLLVAGHTARAGTVANQRRISQGRAQSVADYLVSLEACDKENIRAVGFGADRSIGDNRTAEGMAANRRVEITILED